MQLEMPPAASHSDPEGDSGHRVYKPPAASLVACHKNFATRQPGTGKKNKFLVAGSQVNKLQTTQGTRLGIGLRMRQKNPPVKRSDTADQQLGQTEPAPPPTHQHPRQPLSSRAPRVPIREGRHGQTTTSSSTSRTWTTSTSRRTSSSRTSPRGERTPHRLPAAVCARAAHQSFRCCWAAHPAPGGMSLAGRDLQSHSDRAAAPTWPRLCRQPSR